MKHNIQGRHYNSFILDDLVGDEKTADWSLILDWFRFLQKELQLKMSEENDIIQERSPLEPYRIVLRHVWFEENLAYYKEIKRWLKEKHPKVFVVEGQSSAWEINDAVTIYFVTKELYMEFVDKWPKVLRGEDNET